MSLHVNASGGGDFELVPEGIYIARCYRLIDLGTQTGPPQYGSKPVKKVSISWELLNDDMRMEDGRPFSVHKTYTASTGELATLRAHLESWRGKKFTEDELKDFDLSKILGSYCQIQVVHDETGKYANVQAIMALPKNTAKPKAVNADVAFDIDNPDMAVFEALSDNMKGKIMSAPEWQAKARPAAPVKATPSKLTTEPEPDVVIEDIDQPISLDDIPF